MKKSLLLTALFAVITFSGAFAQTIGRTDQKLPAKQEKSADQGTPNQRPGTTNAKPSDQKGSEQGQTQRTNKGQYKGRKKGSGKGHAHTDAQGKGRSQGQGHSEMENEKHGQGHEHHGQGEMENEKHGEGHEHHGDHNKGKEGGNGSAKPGNKEGQGRPTTPTSTGGGNSQKQRG